MKQIPIIIWVLLSSFQVLSQDYPIFTDRPNVTDAVNLIAPGTFQVELGYYQTINSNLDIVRSRTTSVPNFSLKYGLLEWLEFRFLSSHQLSRTESSIFGVERVEGLTPFIISPKFSLFQQSGWIPDISFATSFTIPADVGRTYDSNFNLGLIFLLQYTFEKISVATSAAFDNEGFSSITDASPFDVPRYRYTLVGGYSITDQLGTFLEMYGPFGQDDFWFDFGFSYLVSNNFSVDIIYDRNLNGLNIQSFGFGLAWKTDLKK